MHRRGDISVEKALGCSMWRCLFNKADVMGTAFENANSSEINLGAM
jgi:hypothetical protein